MEITKEQAIESVEKTKDYVKASLSEMSIEEKAALVSSVKEIVESLNAKHVQEWEDKLDISEDLVVEEIAQALKTANAGLSALMRRRRSRSHSNQSGNLY